MHLFLKAIFVLLLTAACQKKVVTTNTRSQCEADCHSIVVKEGLNISAPERAAPNQDVTVSWTDLKNFESVELKIATDKSCTKPAFSIKDITDSKFSLQFNRAGDFYICLEITLSNGITVTPQNNGQKISVSDSSKESSSGNKSANAAPSAVADSVTVTEDTTKDLDVLSNDTDPDSYTLVIDSVTQPNKGAVSITSDQKIKFVPTENAVGSDSFTYTVKDKEGATATATVDVTIKNVNDDPTASPDSAITEAGSAVNISVLSNDSDVDSSDTLSISSVGTPSNGSAVISGTDIQYTPNGGFDGTDSFTYTISDGNGGSAHSTVTIKVYPTLTAFTWTGGGSDNNWSTAANWYGGATPGASDVAVFSAKCPEDCPVVIDASTTIGGLSLHETFSGEITQSAGATFTVGSSGYAQDGGTFTGSDADITISSLFTMTAGSFKSTSATFKLNTAPTSDATIFSMSSNATFEHNEGLVVFVVNQGGLCNAKTGTIDLDSTLELYDVEFDGNTTCTYHTKLDIAAGDKIIVTGNLTHTDGRIGGVWDLEGHLIVGAGAEGGMSNSAITFVGTGTQTYHYTSGIGTGNIYLNSATTTVQPATGVSALRAQGLIIQSGSFVAPSGTLTLSDSPSSDRTMFSVASGSSFSHSNGSILFLITPSGACGYAAGSIDVDSNLELNNIEFNGSSGCGTHTKLSVASGDSVTVKGDLTHTDGLIGGSWNLEGNLIIGTDADGGLSGAALSFVGSGTQTYSYTSGSGTAPLYINSATTSVSPDTGVTDLRIKGLHIQAGSFFAPSGTLTIHDSLSSDLTIFSAAPGATFVHNSGTLQFLVSPYSACGYKTGKIDVDTSINLYDVEFDGHSGCGTHTKLTVESGDSVIVKGSMTHTDGVLHGDWNVEGNLTIGASADGGSTTMNFVGTGSQTIDNSAGGDVVNGNFTITSTVDLASDLTLNGSTQNLTVDGGTLNKNGYTTTVAGSESAINGGTINP